MFILHLLLFREHAEPGQVGKFINHADAEGGENLSHFLDMDGLLHVLQGRIQGHVPLDGGELIGKVGHVLIFNEFLLPGPLDFFHMGIEVVQVFIFRQELKGRLFADPRHPRDIVCRIPHEGFDIDHLGRGNMVFLHNRFRRHAGHIRNPLLRQEDGRLITGKLQRIPVTGDDIDRKLVFIAGRKSPQHVIPFIAGNAVHGHPHSPKNVDNQIKLGYQFIRRRFSRRFIAIIHFGAERVTVLIKSDRHVFGIQIPIQAEQHAEKSVNRIRRSPVRSRHGRRQSIKSAKQETAPIDNDQFLFHKFLP